VVQLNPSLPGALDPSLDIRTLQEANGYLQKNFLRRYNERFRVSAAKEPGVYRPAPLWRVLEGILCWKESRTLARDHTFSLEGKLWQVLPHEKILALAGRRVEVRRPLRGPLQAWSGALRLTIRPVAADLTPPALAAAEPTYPVRGRLRG